jgi:selenocysteine lyase/cysteine desulfurase
MDANFLAGAAGSFLGGAVDARFLFSACGKKAAPVVAPHAAPDTATAAAWAHGFAACQSGQKQLRAAGARGDTLRLPAPIGDFFIPADVAYLNCATLGPTPRHVLDSVVAEWQWLEADPLNHYFGGGERGACTRMEVARAAAARFVGCDCAELVMVPSTTVAYNMVAEGLVSSGYLQPADTVLTTDQEHPGGENCWLHYAGLGKLKYVNVAMPNAGRPGSAEEIVAAFEDAMNAEAAAGRRPRVLALSHVLTTTGLVMPVAELAALAHRKDAFLLVDGAQAVGGMEVNVSALGCDAYTVSAHKWALAPAGSGLLYLREAIQPQVQAAFLRSGHSAYSTSSGTRADHTIAGLAGSLAYLERFGVRAIAAHNRKLRARAWDGLRALSTELEIEVVSPPAGPLSGAILGFAMPDALQSGALAADLLKRGIVVKTGTYRKSKDHAANCIRLAFHLYNTTADVDRLLAELPSAFVALRHKANEARI